MPTNPFTDKKYFIHDAIRFPVVINQPTTDYSSFSSYISNSSSPTVANKFDSTGPFNIIELEEEVSSRLQHFIEEVSKVKLCDYARYNGDSNYYMNSCDAKYQLHDNSLIFSQSSINDISILREQLNKIRYKQPLEKQKELWQQLQDINSLLTTLKNYITTDITSSTVSEYNNEINSLYTKHNEINNLRNTLEQKLDSIYSTDTRNTDSIVMLDSTIYTSVLWTVLATSIIFFMFKKM
jgi:hypothetical protein